MAFDILREFDRFIQPLRVRVLNTVTRAVVKLVDDSQKFQALQVEMLNGEVRSDVERVQNYGFTSVPLEGAEAVGVCVGGKREHAVVIAVDDRRYRLVGLEAGEVAIYTDQGDKVVLKRGGTIQVTASTKVELLTPLVECSTNLKVLGKLDVTGNITGSADVAGAKVLDGGIELGTHTHGITTAGLGGSVTSAPGSVTVLTGTTGAPS